MALMKGRQKTNATALFSQLIWFVCTAWETSYDITSRHQDMPVAEIMGQSRKRKDPIAVSDVVGDNTTKRNKRGSEEIARDASIAACLSALTSSSIGRGAAREVWRYREAGVYPFRSSAHGDMSVSHDGARAYGKEWLLAAAMDTESRLAIWCPPQETQSILKLDG